DRWWRHLTDRLMRCSNCIHPIKVYLRRKRWRLVVGVRAELRTRAEGTAPVERARRGSFTCGRWWAPGPAPSFTRAMGPPSLAPHHPRRGPGGDSSDGAVICRRSPALAPTHAAPGGVARVVRAGRPDTSPGVMDRSRR